MNFDLVFNRDTQGYAESNLKNQLGAFTLSFWMKGVQDDLEAGTPVSYAVNVGGMEYSVLETGLDLPNIVPDAFL